MATTDGDFAPDGGYPDAASPQPKKRNTKHYKAIAKAAEKLAAERLTQVDLEQKTTLILATKLAKMRGAATLAVVEFLVILWLAFWHYKP